MRRVTPESEVFLIRWSEGGEYSGALLATTEKKARALARKFMLADARVAWHESKRTVCPHCRQKMDVNVLPFREFWKAYKVTQVTLVILVILKEAVAGWELEDTVQGLNDEGWGTPESITLD